MTLGALTEGQLGLAVPFAVVISPGCVRSAVGAWENSAEIVPLAAPRVVAAAVAGLRTKEAGPIAPEAPRSALPARKRACCVPRRTPVRRAGAGLSARRGQGAGWRRSTVIPWSDSNCNAPRTRRDAERCSYVLSRAEMCLPISILGSGMVFWPGMAGVADKTGKGHSGWRASSYEVTPSRSDGPGDGRRIVSRPAGMRQPISGPGRPRGKCVSPRRRAGRGRPRGRRTA